MVDLLQENGHNLRMPHVKKIGDKFWELRIIYTFNKNQIIILNWFAKKTNKIPTKEIEIARKRLTTI